MFIKLALGAVPPSTSFRNRCYKTFHVGIYEFSYGARVFVPSKPFQGEGQEPTLEWSSYEGQF